MGRPKRSAATAWWFRRRTGDPRPPRRWSGMHRPKSKRRAAAAVPDDALVEIFSRLPAKSLCRSKCVSRAWRDLIADRLRCTSLPQTLAGFFYVYDDGDEVCGCRCDGCSSGGECSDRVIGRFVDTTGRSVPLASFSFLGRQPWIKEFGILSSCNGLLLFGHRMLGDSYDSLGYIVCNPATEQWVAVPSSGWKPYWLEEWYEHEESDSDSDTDDESNLRFTYMIFDPATSPHFQLVEFWTPTYDATTVEEVHTYSSETGVWCQRTNMWDDSDEEEAVAFAAGGAFVNGMLHLSATSFAEHEKYRELIIAVDGEGKNRRVISGPKKDCNVAFIGESQGHLHLVDEHRDKTRGMAELSIWILRDYDAEEWVLKHTVTYMHLFGRTDCRAHSDFRVIAVHPDRNLIFFFQHWDLKLISYDMDSQEVCIIRSLGVGRQTITPYVPYFAELPALASKQ